MSARAQLLSGAALLAAALLSLMSLADAREQLRAAEREKHGLRQSSIALRDEGRSLQLEYDTLTSYNTISARAADLQMQSPGRETGSYLYLNEQETP